MGGGLGITADDLHHFDQLDESPGLSCQTLWDDISPLNSQAKERLGYPTQKPIALLERIVRASSNGQQVAAGYQALSQSLPFIDRVHDAITRYLDSAPVTGSRPLADVQTLALEQVSYAYRRGRPVLSDISFEVDRRQAVGIIGGTPK